MLFASAITVTASPSEGDPSTDTVGRTGAHSLFDVLSKVCPSATRDRHGRGDGVSEAELNKLVEKAGFQRIRFRARARSLVNRESDDYNSYRFGKRRWRNPDDPNDMEAIAKVWQYFAGFTACSLEDMAQILREAISAETLFKTKRRTQATLRKNHSPLSLNDPGSFNLESSGNIWALTDERASVSPCFSRVSAVSSEERHPCAVSPSSSHFSTDEGSHRVIEDDEELQAKLDKERFSAEGLPSPYNYGVLPLLPCDIPVSSSSGESSSSAVY